MKTYGCPFCLRNINLAQLKKHLRTHNLIDIELEYYNIRFKNKEYIINNIIKDYKFGLSIGDLIKKYNFNQTEIYHILDFNNIEKRSHSESKKTKQYKEKYEKTNLEKYGVKNISQLSEIKERKKDTMMKNFGRINNFQDASIRSFAKDNIDYEKTWESIQSTLKEKYNVKNFSQIPSARKTISRKAKNRCNNMSYEEKREMTKIARSKCKGYSSNLELKVHEILNDLNIEYSVNKFLFGYNYDIIFPERIILEIQGDFWHANPNIYKETDILNFPKRKRTAKEIWEYDKRKRQIAEKKGYKVIYIWETEINELTKPELFEQLKIKLT
jgi:G:T-mismatch repair DNA endonuclease (very short patch repair protein)